jgi:hypothetical protein
MHLQKTITVKYFFNFAQTKTDNKTPQKKYFLFPSPQEK